MHTLKWKTKESHSQVSFDDFFCSLLFAHHISAFDLKNISVWYTQVSSDLSDRELLLVQTRFLWTNRHGIGNLLNPVIDKFFMGHFEQKSIIDSFDHNQAAWFRYVDDTFVAWNHEKDMLKQFLDHLNVHLPSIQFIMETEQKLKR